MRMSCSGPDSLLRIRIGGQMEQSKNHTSTLGAGFGRFSAQMAREAGSAKAFIFAIAIIVGWGAIGPIYHYSDTWQLVINTGTTIITFLMVFLIQNTQNRDARAIHLKLDELIRSVKGARTELIDLEELSDDELEELHKQFKRIAERARADLRKGILDTGSP